METGNTGNGKEAMGTTAEPSSDVPTAEMGTRPCASAE